MPPKPKDSHDRMADEQKRIADALELIAKIGCGGGGGGGGDTAELKSILGRIEAKVDALRNPPEDDAALGKGAKDLDAATAAAKRALERHT